MFAEDRTERDAQSRINLHTINLIALDADPADAKDGDIWRFHDDMGPVDVLRCKVGGVVKTISFAA